MGRTYNHSRQGGCCIKCGTLRRRLHRDHIVPKWNGGSDDESNFQYLCANCHEDKTYEELNSVAYAEMVSKCSRKMWADPTMRKRIKLSMQDVQKRVETREAQSKWQKAWRSTPDGREKLSRATAAALESKRNKALLPRNEQLRLEIEKIEQKIARLREEWF